MSTPSKSNNSNRRKKGYAVIKSRRTGLTNEQIIRMYRLKECNMTATAKALRMERTALYGYVANDPELEAALKQVKEETIDWAEDQLLRQMRGYTYKEEFVGINKDGIHKTTIERVMPADTGAIIFFLKTRGKDRGYGQRVELTGANGASLFKDLVIEIKGSRSKIDLTKLVDAEAQVVKTEPTALPPTNGNGINHNGNGQHT